MIIKVDNLNFEYADKRALDNVSFGIEEGAITALVGPNGAGKTTLLRCLAGLAKPLTGEIHVNGYSAIDQPREVHTQVGYLSDFFGLYDALTVRQSLQFTAYSRITDLKALDDAIELAALRSGISSFIDKKCGALSRGMRQRVGIAQAIIHRPKVLLLDEPASGLDPEARHSLSSLLLELRDEGMVIIVSSHILAELEDYSTEMMVIEQGKMIEHRVLNTVLSQMRNMLLKFETGAQGFADIIAKWDGISDVQVADKEMHIKLDEQVMSKRALLKKLLQNDLPLEEAAEARMNLQDEYIKTVRQFKEGKSR
jgi:ABC-2 type transport system ATP-binding protein